MTTYKVGEKVRAKINGTEYSGKIIPDPFGESDTMACFETEDGHISWVAYSREDNSLAYIIGHINEKQK